MNTGQTILTIGGMMILTTLILRMNNTNYYSSTEMYQSKFRVMATSFATSYMEEIRNKKFDEKTVGAVVSDSTKFSSTLGSDTGEDKDTFDDIDDYNADSTWSNFPQVSNIPPPVFKIKCSVKYYNPYSETTTSSKQYHKQISVTVTGDSLGADTIRLSTIYSYWVF